MTNKKERLKAYKEILLLCKTLQIINKIDMEIENKIPTYKKEKTKENKVNVLTLFR